MRRHVIQKLIEWKRRKDRKPLIIRGARQVGKTWLMQEFAKTEYEHTAYISFDDNPAMLQLFSKDYDIDRLITGLSLESDVQIDASNTLIIFDEVQECPRALKSLKYFNENRPDYHIVAAGSKLGIALHQNVSFPVGKVEFLDLHPLSFYEFVDALGEEKLLSLCKKLDFSLISTFKDKFNYLLKLYYYVGGMPGVVSAFIEKSDFKRVREIQKNILISYEQDISKHVSSNIVSRLLMLWNSIPSQLAKENKKFIYGQVKEGARAKEYELALTWLHGYGLIHKVNRVKKPGLPLKGYEDINAFKLFVLDIGLLGALAKLDAKVLLHGDRVFEEFRGSLTEQYVVQQLKILDDLEVCYWSSEAGSSELDFLIQLNGNIIPIEAKAATNLRAKSLRIYTDTFKPKIAIRTSMADYKKTRNLHDIPLYLLESLSFIVEQ